MTNRFSAGPDLAPIEGTHLQNIVYPPIGVFTLTPDDKMASTNPALARMLGYDSPQELIKSVTDIERQFYADPSDREEIKSLLKEQGVVINRACRLHRRNGTQFQGKLIIRTVRDTEGNVDHYLGFVTDISDLKYMDEKKRSVVSEVNNFYEKAPCGHHSLDNEGYFLRINSTELSWLGYTREELIGKMKFSDLLTASSREIFEKTFPAFKEKGHVNNLEYEMIRKNGTIMPVLLNATAVKDEAGNYLMSRSTIIDITELKKAHSDKLKNKKIMAQAEELAGLGGWEWDLKSDTWLLSENWTKIHGVSDIQPTTPQVLSLAHPEDRPAIEEALAGLRERGEPYDIEYRIARQDTGELRTVHSRAFVERDVNGVPEQMIGMLQDITERKQGERELQRSRDLLDCSQSLAQIGGWEWDVKHQTMYWTDEAYRLHGLESSELEAGSREHIVRSMACYDPEDRPVIQTAFQNCVEHGQAYDLEFPITKTDGSRIWIRTMARPVTVDGQIVKVMGNMIDITERRKSDEAVSQLNQELLKSNAQKDTLFSIIAHDLKSPMSGLLTSTKMLADQKDVFSESEIQLLATELHNNAKNTFALLEDLLQWSRMNMGAMDFAPTLCSLGELANINLHLARNMATRKNIEIHGNIPDGLMVLADQSMISTLIRNLLFNAVKFTHQNGEIAISARQEGQTVTVTIADNGIGMSEQVVSKLFTLEKDKRQQGTEGEKGTGLGLVLCKQFIEQHGGQIWAKSTPEQGTTVYFTLPAGDAA